MCDFMPAVVTVAWWAMEGEGALAGLTAMGFVGPDEVVGLDANGEVTVLGNTEATECLMAGLTVVILLVSCLKGMAVVVVLDTAALTAVGLVVVTVGTFNLSTALIAGLVDSLLCMACDEEVVLVNSPAVEGTESKGCCIRGCAAAADVAEGDDS